MINSEKKINKQKKNKREQNNKKKIEEIKQREKGRIQMKYDNRRKPSKLKEKLQ